MTTATAQRKLTPLDGNPLYAEWCSHKLVRGRGLYGYDVPSFPGDADWMPSLVRAQASREQCTRRYSWAVPSPKAIEWIAARCKQLMEIGAGRGYWAHLLARAGCKIAAYDESIDGDDVRANHWHSSEFAYGLYYPVEKGGPEKAAEHPRRTLMLCWAPYDDPMARDALAAYRGHSLLWIGEGDGGCCGGEDFWKLIRDGWDEVEHVAIPQWPGIRDYVQLYRRKGSERRRAFHLESQ